MSTVAAVAERRVRALLCELHAAGYNGQHVRAELERQGFLTPAERETYEERAAIREYDGGMDRDEAERAALADVRRMRGALLKIKAAIIDATPPPRLVSVPSRIDAVLQGQEF